MKYLIMVLILTIGLCAQSTNHYGVYVDPDFNKIGLTFESDNDAMAYGLYLNNWDLGQVASMNSFGLIMPTTPQVYFGVIALNVASNISHVDISKYTETGLTFGVQIGVTKLIHPTRDGSFTLGISYERVLGESDFTLNIGYRY